MLVLVLEQPTWRRQVALFALVGLLFATRVQAVGVPPSDRDWRRSCSPRSARRSLRVTIVRLRLSTGCSPAAAALVLAPQLARGASLTNLFGAYAVVGDDVLRRGDGGAVLPLPPRRARPLLRRAPLRGVRAAHAARTAARAARSRRSWLRGLALTASSCSSSPRSPPVFANRIQERNTFVVAPLLPDRAARLGRPRRARRPASSRSRPRDRVRAAAAGDPVGALHRDGRHLRHARAAADLVGFRLAARSTRSTGRVLAGGAVAALFCCWSDRAGCAVLPAVDAALPAHVLRTTSGRGEHGFRQASAGALFQGIRVGPRDWIDRALPDGRRPRSCGPASPTDSRSTRTSSSTARSGRSTTSAGRRPAGSPRPS